MARLTAVSTKVPRWNTPWSEALKKSTLNFRALELQANFSTWWILNKASMRAFLGLWPSFVSKWRNESYHYIALEKAYSQIDPIYRAKFYPVLFTCNSRKKKLNTIPWRSWDCASAHRLLSMFSLEAPLSSICCSLALLGAKAALGWKDRFPNLCTAGPPCQLTPAHLELAQKLHSPLWPQCRCTLRGAEQPRKLFKT